MHYNCQGTISLILLSIFLTTSLTRSQLNLTGVNSHVVQLEKALEDLQSQTKIQEQNHAALLSIVLSKLTTTTDELATLRLEHNSTVVQLAALQRDHNSTIQTLSTLQKDHNDTLAAVTGILMDIQTQTNMSVTQELDTVKDEVKAISQHFNFSSDIGQLKLEMTTMLRNMSDLHSFMQNVSGSSVSNIYFQVTTTGNQTILYTLIDGHKFPFDKVLLNEGGWYDTKTGIFEAPASGIYLFWAHIMNKFRSTFSVQLTRDDNLLSEDTTYKQQNSANIFHIMEISKGEKVWFTCVDKDSNTSPKLCTTPPAFGQDESYYGGMLLRNN